MEKGSWREIKEVGTSGEQDQECKGGAVPCDNPHGYGWSRLPLKLSISFRSVKSGSDLFTDIEKQSKLSLHIDKEI